MRPLIYGNGSLLVCVDERGIVRDFYYPHAGMENHGGYIRLGLYDIGAKRFAWLENWKKTQGYRNVPGEPGEGILEGTSMIGESTFSDPGFGASVVVNEMVHHEKDLFLRTITVQNTSSAPRSFRLFSAQNYHILENNYANTAVRDGPMMNHYKRNRFFVQSSRPVFDVFSTGISEWGDKLGTWKDAEDGQLEGNVVAHGTVDSTVGWTLPVLLPGESTMVHFWVCVGQDFREARGIHGWIREQDIGMIFDTGAHYWSSFCARAFSRRALTGFDALPPDVQGAFTRSLLTVAAHIDKGGSIIASCDSQIKQQGADYYTYCWPRDAAWAGIALDRAGYGYICRNTYRFFARIMDRKGFFRHKYTPSGDLGSTWHPLPMLQIDETGLPLQAAWLYWLENRNIKMLSSMYEPFIRPAADFLVSFIDRETGLPKPSFDLWEERKGVYTYSCACVYAGLESAASIAGLIGDRPSAMVWGEAAQKLKEAIIARLYDEKLGRFLRGVGDDAVDASLFAVWYLDVVSPDSEMARGTMRAIEQALTRPDNGIARYAGDRYQGYMNSWPLCTLWLAEWHIRTGNLDRALSLLRWAIEHSAQSGLMPEQVGDRAEPASVLPLAWSHSTFVLAVIEYLEALAARQPVCPQP
ncbi:MAG: glycoside hydrolase family 15 protein [Methanocella sp.]